MFDTATKLTHIEKLSKVERMLEEMLGVSKNDSAVPSSSDIMIMISMVLAARFGNEFVITKVRETP